MTFRRTLLPALSIFVALSLPGIAGAQVEREAKTDDGNYYKFKDDLLNMLTSGPMGAQIEVRPKKYRVQLIRPRSHFIPEMFKSVEHL
jgi:hypothetical protein